MPAPTWEPPDPPRGPHSESSFCRVRMNYRKCARTIFIAAALRYYLKSWKCESQSRRGNKARDRCFFGWFRCDRRAAQPPRQPDQAAGGKRKAPSSRLANPSAALPVRRPLRFLSTSLKPPPDVPPGLISLSRL